eukprot:comp20442_c0_seq1/m.25985 comp20442_c0_seq1/g.25985  ORF comp20442_c0_seq1/g.25985 comp20442_c0_seq1/m.25985 type:complete len:1073 (-) comp20442_c0_seq1:89-3307(-)
MAELSELERRIDELMALAEVATEEKNTAEVDRLLAEIDRLQEEYDAKLENREQNHGSQEEKDRDQPSHHQEEAERDQRRRQEEMDRLLAEQIHMEEMDLDDYSDHSSSPTHSSSTNQSFSTNIQSPSQQRHESHNVKREPERSSSPPPRKQDGPEIIDLTDMDDIPIFTRRAPATYSFTAVAKEDIFGGVRRPSADGKRPADPQSASEDVKRPRPDMPNAQAPKPGFYQPYVPPESKFKPAPEKPKFEPKIPGSFPSGAFGRQTSEPKDEKPSLFSDLRDKINKSNMFKPSKPAPNLYGNSSFPGKENRPTFTGSNSYYEKEQRARYADEASFLFTGRTSSRYEDDFHRRYGDYGGDIDPGAGMRPLGEEDVQEIYNGLNADHKPLPESEVPKELKVNLMPYQLVGVAWMMDREKSRHKGGLLADDMGLGKTVQTITTILKNRQTDLTKPKITLVLAPLALLAQWRDEIQDKTGGALKAVVYHGQGRKKLNEDIRNGVYDVVITTYSTLANEWVAKKGLLMPLTYHRIVLDEAQSIKNRNTKGAKACFELKATYRWALSGTPIQNNLEELYSLFHFLKLQNYGDWSWFKTQIKARSDRNIKRLQAIMTQVCLRRLKTMKYQGKPLIELPKRIINLSAHQFTADEQEFYTALETRAQIRFNTYVREGTVMKNYSHILVLLLRLRQACCHPSLPMEADLCAEATGERIFAGSHGGSEAGSETASDPPSTKSTDKSDDAPTSGEKPAKQKAPFLTPEALARVQEVNPEEFDCPICFDLAEIISVTKCGHLFCNTCIEDHMSRDMDRQDDNTARCPTCRGSIAETDVKRLKDVVPSRKDKRIGPDPVVVAKKVAKAAGHQNAPPNLDEPPARTELGIAKYGQWVSSTKIDKLMEHLINLRKEGKGERSVVFSQFTKYLDLIEIPLTCHGFKFLRYDGSMNVPQREEAVRLFRSDPSYTVIIMSLKCASVGLNLAVASRVFLMDVWWNPAVEDQAIDRVHRIGQKNDVIVERLTIKLSHESGSVEDRILRLQEEKRELVKGAFNEGGNGKAKLTVDDLKFLFGIYTHPRPNPQPQQV